jgi:hypothetical protein
MNFENHEENEELQKFEINNCLEQFAKLIYDIYKKEEFKYE